jgi:hypothetical protein
MHKQDHSKDPESTHAQTVIFHLSLLVVLDPESFAKQSSLTYIFCVDSDAAYACLSIIGFACPTTSSTTSDELLVIGSLLEKWAS